MTAQPRSKSAILSDVAAQLRPLLDGSEQGVYVYLDDAHKVCNQQFAEMLGYDSPADWDRQGPFTDLYVDSQSQRTLVGAYGAAMGRGVPDRIDVVWKRRDGGRFPTTVHLVPIAHGEQLLALHFIAPR